MTARVSGDSCGSLDTVAATMMTGRLLNRADDDVLFTHLTALNMLLIKLHTSSDHASGVREHPLFPFIFMATDQPNSVRKTSNLHLWQDRCII